MIEVFRSAYPFVIISLLMLVLVFFVRPIATWLPGLLG
jgi:TRAP-type C4-dicarboxylate transport system permease large subunit